MLKGHVIDSAVNVRLEGVSVSAYLGNSDKIFQLQVSKRFGSFVFDNLPSDTSITIKLDYLGYQSRSKKVRIRQSDSELDMGFIHMVSLANEIEAVEIDPPVRMNGDTVEFNTNAFHLDSNAVIEDLFHKLPGMLVWGDGKITYNGKTITSIKVDGKEFFGTDHKIMTQNLPKNAIDKIQVYKIMPDNKNQPDQDSKYEINLRLKDDAKKGFFGTVSLNGGTDSRYNVLGLINTYTSRLQASAGLVKNNTNLNIHNVETLLKGTTFGGVNANAEFYSDFFQSGITERNLYGGRFQYDFNDRSPNEYSNLFKLDIHRDDAKKTVIDSAGTDYFSGDIDSESQQINYRLDHSKLFSISPEYQYQNDKIILAGNFEWNNNQLRKESTNSSVDSYEGILTHSHTQSYGDSKDSDFKARITLSNKPIIISQGKQRGLEKLKYRVTYEGNLSGNNSTNMSHRITESSEDNLPYDYNITRQYSSERKRNDNTFGLVLEDLQTLNHRLNFAQITLSNYFQQNQHVQEVFVEDIEMNNNISSKTINTGLSHESMYLSKQFYSNLELNKYITLDEHDMRFKKELGFKGNIKANGAQWDNESTLDFRNIDRNFYSLFPSAEISYRHQKEITTDIIYKISAESFENYPTLEQIAPIYDNIDAFNRFYGGAKLIREKVNKFQADFTFLQKKSDGYDLNVKYTFSDIGDPIVDSVIFYPKYQENYLTNSDRNTKLHSTSLQIKKYFLLDKLNRLSVQSILGGSLREDERFINTLSQLTKRYSYNQSVNLTYYYSDKIQIVYNNQFNTFSTYQREANKINKYNLSQLRHDLGLTYVFARKLYINTNVNSRTFYKKGGDNEFFFIWNASVRYRVLKGNNLEFKMTALDILGQNMGVYVINNERQQTYGIRNTLTQYFMMGLTYYPRKFNLNK